MMIFCRYFAILLIIIKHSDCAHSMLLLLFLSLTRTMTLNTFHHVMPKIHIHAQHLPYYPYVWVVNSYINSPKNVVSKMAYVLNLMKSKAHTCQQPTNQPTMQCKFSWLKFVVQLTRQYAADCKEPFFERQTKIYICNASKRMHCVFIQTKEHRRIPENFQSNKFNKTKFVLSWKSISEIVCCGWTKWKQV